MIDRRYFAADVCSSFQQVGPSHMNIHIQVRLQPRSAQPHEPIRCMRDLFTCTRMWIQDCERSYFIHGSLVSVRPRVVRSSFSYCLSFGYYFSTGAWLIRLSSTTHNVAISDVVCTAHEPRVVVRVVKANSVIRRC